MTQLILTSICVALGLLLTWRCLVNANHMDRTTHHGIRALNLVLLLASVGILFGPSVGPDFTTAALQTALAAFIVCMFIGRRPTDRVLGK